MIIIGIGSEYEHIGFKYLNDNWKDSERPHVIGGDKVEGFCNDSDLGLMFGSGGFNFVNNHEHNPVDEQFWRFDPYDRNK